MLLVWPLLVTSWGYGQEASKPAAQAQPAQTSGPTAEMITTETIDAALKAVDEATDLDEVAQGQLREIYSEAKAELGKAAEQLSEAARFKSSIESATADIQQAGMQNETLQGYDFDAVRNLALNDLNKERSTLEQQLTDAKNELLELQAEPQRRVDRLAAIPDEISNARSALTKLQEQLDAIDSTDPSSLPNRAQRLLLQSRQQALLALVDRLESERGTYEAQGELPRLRSDLLTTRVKQLEQDILGLVDVITERRRTDAAEQKANAELAWKNAPQWLKPYAQVNIDRADRRLELASDIRGAAALRDRVEKQLARWQEDFERTRSGPLSWTRIRWGCCWSRSGRSCLPVLLLKQRILEGDATISTAQQELYELEDRRADLSDVNAAADQVLADLRKQGLSVPADPDGQFRQLFNAESLILDSLLNDANRDYSLRIATRESQRKLIDVVEQYRVFIDQNVFWVPSAAPLRPLHIADSALCASLAGRHRDGQGSGHAIWQAFRASAVPPVPALVGCAWIASIPAATTRRTDETRRSRSAGVLSHDRTHLACDLGHVFARRSLARAGVGTRLDIGGFNKRAGGATREGVFRYIMVVVDVGFIGQMWRPYGLADAHFGWSTTVRQELDRCLHLLIIVGTPLLFLSSVYQQHGDPAFRASMGRLALIALMLLIAWCSWRLFREHQVERESDEDTVGDGRRHWSIWSRVAVVVPLALASLAAIGFNYSAFQLTLNCVFTFTLALILLVLRAVMFRWVRVARRRIRWQQLLDARQRRGEGGETSDASDISAPVSKEEETDLAAMDRQTRRLISIVIATMAVIGSAAIWLEVLPALMPILETPVNPFHLSSDTAAPITIGSLLIALATVVLTIAGWRNIPGLIDVLLLGRLGIESRFATQSPHCPNMRLPLPVPCLPSMRWGWRGVKSNGWSRQWAWDSVSGCRKSWLILCAGSCCCLSGRFEWEISLRSVTQLALSFVFVAGQRRFRKLGSPRSRDPQQGTDYGTDYELDALGRLESAHAASRHCLWIGY